MSGCWQCQSCGRQIGKAVTLPVHCRCGTVDVTGEGVDRCESRGLGDTIAKFTTAIGIPPCGGCGQRQETLNELFPYSQEPTAE